MGIELNEKYVAALINRISEALQIHARFRSVDEVDFSALPITQDVEAGWLDVAMNELDEDGNYGKTEVFRVEVMDAADYKRTEKGD